MISNKKEVSSENRILHVNDIARAYYSKIQQLETASPFAYLGTALAKKEDRLAECAKMYLKLGDIKQFCEIMISLSKGPDLTYRLLGKSNSIRSPRLARILAKLC